MANTHRSKKAKGKRLEQQVAKAYRSSGIDDTAKPMPASGALRGGHFKGDILKRYDNEWVDECKNQDKVRIWEFWRQTEAQAHGLQRPVLHISGNYRPILSVMRLDDYIDLRKTVADLEEELSRVKSTTEES